ncbi:aspartyl/asparaginyl-tRNA synthetases [Pelotomaculum thermopropionicum SI]|uniref:Asparagine--tRNA ligase n=1 Tax=Pelotomaculum thermopropionicum (strain DSM 13744 / JCM 10971 / SI) TaxID=370438 RepID=SYN_PELTS|nr:RecName: Full=Asparagine--tRNA ligase; AltName: Full=Asparaginyl-tRNA synthetase; Short=AsnRS [Pelotomaculum thermopropionicum SI]BAF59601.1 aspartyl/asparaginyl-tRNA synthetases [Pelotomaculum thermopropionicum SI]
MEKVLIKHLGNYAGQEVLIKGWLYNKRSSGKICFLIVRDGTGLVQGVVEKKAAGEDLFSLAGNITQESSLMLRGTVREEPRAPGGFEIQVTGLEIVHMAEPYPISLKEHGVDFLAERRHLWIRTPRQSAILRIRSELEKGCRDFFEERDFVLADAPIITPTACEGTTNLFEIDYHGEKAYLSQSGQLYNEATAMALGRVYCFGPTFRAEKSKTRRHLMEFWMVEAEAAFFDFEDNIRLQEELVSYLVRRVLENNKKELELLRRDTGRLTGVTPPFPRMSYTDAVDFLNSKGVDFKWGDDFGAPHETMISEHFGLPVFIHRFPVDIKAFYMKPDPENPDVVLGADLLAPEGYGEIIGGGQRIDELELLKKRLVQHKLPEEAFEWYLDLRRYGSVPHSGFGLGLERLLAWICGIEHIREAIPFPRMLYRMCP